MEEVVNSVSEWFVTLVAERWIEILVLLAMIGIWRWFTFHELRKEIAELKAEKTNQAVLISANTIHIGDVRAENGKHHATIRGEGKIVSPIPIRLTGGGSTQARMSSKLTVTK